MHTYYLLMPSGWEIFVILFVILLLFGGKKIPELMKGIGKGAREFKKGLSGEDEEELYPFIEEYLNATSKPSE